MCVDVPVGVVERRAKISHGLIQVEKGLAGLTLESLLHLLVEIAVVVLHARSVAISDHPADLLMADAENTCNSLVVLDLLPDVVRLVHALHCITTKVRVVGCLSGRHQSLLVDAPRKVILSAGVLLLLSSCVCQRLD